MRLFQVPKIALCKDPVYIFHSVDFVWNLICFDVFFEKYVDVGLEYLSTHVIDTFANKLVFVYL